MAALRHVKCLTHRNPPRNAIDLIAKQLSLVSKSSQTLNNQILRVPIPCACMQLSLLSTTPSVSFASTFKFKSTVENSGSTSRPTTTTSNTWPTVSNHESSLCANSTFDASVVESLLDQMDGDLPLDNIPDPFVKDYKRCFLCIHDIKLDHKNVRLLSQFVSPYTGRIYGRAITGLCIPMQKQVARYIKRARACGFMPIITKDPKYLQDPQPYDPMMKK